jgi:hypothetical protein
VVWSGGRALKKQRGTKKSAIERLLVVRSPQTPLAKIRNRFERIGNLPVRICGAGGA